MKEVIQEKKKKQKNVFQFIVVQVGNRMGAESREYFVGSDWYFK